MLKYLEQFKKEKKQITAYISTDAFEVLDHLCQKYNVSRNSVIQALLLQEKDKK